jgi:hypothetical protein
MKGRSKSIKILIAVILICGLAGCRAVQPRTDLSAKQARKDIQQYFSTVSRCHVNSYAIVGKDGFKALRQEALDEATAIAEANGTINVEELAYILFASAAAFGDGHTTIRWGSADWSGRRFPPFRLNFQNGRWLISAAVDKSIEGCELLSVEGAPIQDFLKPILNRCSGETMIYRSARFAEHQSFYFSFTKVFNSTEPYRLGLRDAAGQERNVTIETLSNVEYCQFLSGLPKPDKRRTSVQFHDGTALFTYPAFHLSSAEKKRIDDIFREVRERNSPNLVLDLRGNGGGNSQMGDYIFRYIYDGTFTQYSKVLVKSSLGGAVWTLVGRERAYGKPDAFYGGRVWLLVDNATFSSASDFAAMFRDYDVGKIVGYETGGLATCFGDTYAFNLKYSGIPCTVSYKQFFGPKPRPGDDEHGVLPDYPMSAEVLADFQNEEDPVLAWTLRRIRENRASASATTDQP